MAVMDGYIRISKVNGRSGDSFLSPKIQRETIERIAREKGVTLGEIVEERDVSGGKRVRVRELGRLVDKIEAGESDGLIVWKSTRFSRNLLDAVETMTRIRDAGGRLLADDYDSRAPMGKALLGLLAGLAEEELDARRDGWDEARKCAIERGVQVAAAPVGYRKDRDGRLIVHEREARKVREIFERRAAGESVMALVRESDWPHVAKIIRNDTYLGVVRSGEYVNERAHEPIVSRELFERVNGTRTRRAPLTGATTADRLLVGLARCSGCGGTLKVTRRTDRHGSQLPDVYYCRDDLKQRCTGRALVRCDDLDAHVADWFERQLASNPTMIDAVAATEELQTARAAVEEALADLDGYIEVTSARDPALFQKGLDARERRVTDAREQEREAQARVHRLPEGGSLLTLWNRFDAPARRRVLGEWLDRVVVTKGPGGPEGRTRVIWANGEDDAGELAA
jgi:DNA invertase Pin-like site-specific DNA recombinase